MPDSPTRTRELQAAEAEIQSGDAARAMTRLAAFDHAADPEAAFLVARAHQALGDLDSALATLRELRSRLGAPTAALEMQLGSVLARMGDTPGALEAMRRAVAAQPALAGAQRNLAALLVGAGMMHEARAALRDALATLPQDATLWVRLASMESYFGAATAALDCLGKAVASIPASATTWREIGQGYAEHWQYEAAERALSRASELDPGLPAIETLVAVVKQELGDTAGALQALARASSREPHDFGAVLAERLMLPQVYGSEADVSRWRARFRDGLDATLRETGRFLPQASAVFDLNRHNFLLAYQGEDDTQLQRGYSKLLGQLAAAARPEWQAPLPIGFDGSRRLRVGFVGGIFRDCTAARYFERWVTALDPRRFERFVYHTAAVSDAVTQRIAASSEHFATLRAGALDAAGRILADRLDVLVHPEVGMSPLSYVLATLRLAPAQAAGWGHPVTTGSDAIDFYFTCGAMEPDDAASHYTERLVRLPELGVDYSLPEAPPPGTRVEAGLPEDRRIYLCAQSLFKVHPRMDDLLAGIAATDERAVLVFFQAPSRRVTEAVAERLQRALAVRGVAPRGQLKFLPRMEGGHFRRVLAMADVVLDTPCWSGGNTSLDAIAAGVPVVTLPGRFMRGRQTAGMLRLMGIDELVATSPEEYVRIAMDVAGDGARNVALRERISDRRGALFNRPEPTAAFAEALLRMGAGLDPG